MVPASICSGLGKTCTRSFRKACNPCGTVDPIPTDEGARIPTEGDVPIPTEPPINSPRKDMMGSDGG